MGNKDLGGRPMSYAPVGLPAANGHDSKVHRYANAVGNFSVQYNLSCLAIALVLGSTSESGNVSLPSPVFPKEPEWADRALFGMAFAGCICGMLCMGILGDILGRQRGLIITSGCIAVAALASAWLTWPTYGMWRVLAVCRFALGFGVGGVYPLAASSAAESEQRAESEHNQGESEHEHAESSQRLAEVELDIVGANDSNPRQGGPPSHSEGQAKYRRRAAVTVAWSFFWQSPGVMAPQIVSLLLVQAQLPHILAFRCVLAFGAVPALFVMFASINARDAPSVTASQSKQTLWNEVMTRRYWILLCGTGGTWLLFDIAYYGVSIFAPFILQTILTVWELSTRTIFATCFSCFGNLSAVYFLQKWEAKTLNTVGFVIMAMSFAALATLGLGSAFLWSNEADFPLFCLLLFSISFGPNTATCVLPTQVFPPNVRSTFHGLSSGSGKIGALIGTLLYPEFISAGISLRCIVALQAGICLVGAVVSHFCIPCVDECVDAGNDDTTAYR
eukprot:GEMP01037474.1.p1 GENE.GEMP01037474.1~~GEMP01037474.1.p1  ORF type:complete len:504 (+),score=109.81 GEMP01037474.1:206-1717(+)